MATPPFPSAVGVWWTSDTFPITEVRHAAGELEELGYGSLWFGEAAGKEALTQAGALLAATQRLRVGTGIANIHARDAMAAEAGGRTLLAQHPGRFLLGLGVSHGPLVQHRSGTYEKPLATMRDYLARMDAVSDKIEPGSGRPPRLLAALGPKMLELSRTAADGAHPYLVTPEQTARTREAVGPDKMVVVEQGIAVTTDRETALRRAHTHLDTYSTLPNYRNSWLRQGFTEDDLARGGSDRLAEALVVWGRTEDIVARVRAHLDAGADHVLVQVLGDKQTDDPRPALRELAPALAAAP
ncbi:putative F420-dependent oxidoreductase [Halopolyspora algeriensis]|uniref:Putative F420-dependent oxidoreductase n=1 Tax=Halopolyspora algeriensis TaxID=1500506 RepID=A0A368W0J2_9ACTN|nr:LLM class F420-dependent oxidoreductase [Halopolyspora algeriensis]RCW46101.1 putative F420-dependent oxidoreductase [Halopolyspora algeriensis]TQM55505.1 putative F420-dependent oxidoreductase [Halopolyspora algeriensis]